MSKASMIATLVGIAAVGGGMTAAMMSTATKETGGAAEGQRAMLVFGMATVEKFPGGPGGGTTWAVAGTLLDAAGNGVVGATITFTSTDGTSIASVTTGTGGAFSTSFTSAAAAGTYTLTGSFTGAIINGVQYQGSSGSAPFQNGSISGTSTTVSVT